MLRKADNHSSLLRHKNNTARVPRYSLQLPDGSIAFCYDAKSALSWAKITGAKVKARKANSPTFVPVALRSLEFEARLQAKFSKYA